MTSLRSRSPSSKRIKLEVKLSLQNSEGVETPQLEEPAHQEDSENSCSICLNFIADRTVIPNCSHEFCFECLLVWTEQSRRCPLCSQAIGEYLIHSIRSRYDYRKHYLSALRTSPLPSRPAQSNAILQSTRHRQRRIREWGTRARNESDEADKLERSIAKRRWIYRHDLYAKHVASNAFTKYRPYPTPAQFAASQDLISRTTTFLRRELQIWEGLDVEFLTTLIISLMKSIDIRSESAVKLISEFLDMDAPYTPGGRHVNAEHFAHEVYTYVRSPYKDLFVYDTVVQYDTPSHLPQPTDIERSHRWRDPSPVLLPSEPSTDAPRRQSQKRSRSRSPERSPSWSPSGRKYSPTRKMGDSGHPRASMSRNSPSPRPSYHIPRSRHRQNVDIGRKNNLADAPPTPVASSSNEGEKEPPMERDVKGKRKANETASGMTTLTDGGDSEIVEPRLGQPPMMTEKDDELDNQTRNMKPIRVFRMPRNRTLLDSVKAHLAVPGASAQQIRADRSSTNPQPSSSSFLQVTVSVPSLMTRLSDPCYVPTANSIKAPNVSGNCQQNAGDYERDKSWQNGSFSRHQSGQKLLHHDIDSSTDSGRQLSLSGSQDSSQLGPSCSTTIKREEPPVISKNNYVSVNDPISTTATLPAVEENKQLQQFPHVQSPPCSSIDAFDHSNSPNQSRSLAHSTSLNSVETRARLLARLEIEKQQVAQQSTTNKICSPQPLDDGPSCSSGSSFAVSWKSPGDAPLKLHEGEPGVLDLASGPLASEESMKNESKLRARARLRIRLAAEKRLAG